MYKVNDSLMDITQKKERGNRIFTLVLSLIILLMITFFVFTKFILISVYVDGRSMEPTFSSGEIVFANKNIAPMEGDVIVIDKEKQRADGGYDWLIKRVIAIGQKDKTIVIEIKDGKVWKGEKDQELIPLVEDYLREDSVTTPVYPDRINHWELSEGEVFYLGDNREVSKDSRSEYGTCRLDQVVGVVPEWAMSMRWLSKFLYDAGQFALNLF